MPLDVIVESPPVQRSSPGFGVQLSLVACLTCQQPLHFDESTHSVILEKLTFLFVLYYVL